MPPFNSPTDRISGAYKAAVNRRGGVCRQPRACAGARLLARRCAPDAPRAATRPTIGGAADARESDGHSRRRQRGEIDRQLQVPQDLLDDGALLNRLP